MVLKVCRAVRRDGPDDARRQHGNEALPTSVSSITYLCGNNQVIALPAILLDGLAEQDLGLAVGVGLGRVEEVDAAVEGDLHAFERGT